MMVRFPPGLCAKSLLGTHKIASCTVDPWSLVPLVGCPCVDHTLSTEKCINAYGHTHFIDDILTVNFPFFPSLVSCFPMGHSISGYAEDQPLIRLPPHGNNDLSKRDLISPTWEGGILMPHPINRQFPCGRELGHPHLRRSTSHAPGSTAFPMWSIPGSSP